MDKEHSDITYLKQDEIGLVISKALSETYKAQPNDPVNFFAKFLLNHSRTARKAKEEKDAEKHVKDMKDKHLAKLKTKEQEEAERQLKKKQKQEKIEQFYASLKSDEESAHDLRDKLNDLA